MEIEDKVCLLNLAENLFNWGKYDPCNYLFVQTLVNLNNRLIDFKELKLAKKVENILDKWAKDKNVDFNSILYIKIKIKQRF